VPPAMVGTLGLALFLYSVGIQYGKLFFAGLTSREGLHANTIALAGVLLSGAVSLSFVPVFDLDPGHALGIFAGSGTSTPTLQAAMAAVGNEEPAVGYSVSYPFGVAGSILFLYISFLILKPRVEGTTGHFTLLEIAVRNPVLFGRRFADVMIMLPAGVQIAALRRAHRTEPVSPNALVAEDDIVLAVGATGTALEQASRTLGVAVPGSLIPDRRDLDYLRVFASRTAVAGKQLGDLDLPGGKATSVLHVRRGDTDLLARPDLRLEYGDRVGLLGHRRDFPALRRYFGDSIKGTAELSYISVGLGMALGFVLGAIAIPIPGMSSISLGLLGVLVAALILGNLQRAGGVNWTMPISANLVLRNLGLTLFLAQVGMSAGPTFVATVAEHGLLMLSLGVLATIALVVPVLLIGFLVFRMPYDEVTGIAAGLAGNPAIFSYASKLAPSERLDTGYAMIFPGMTIVKILFVNVATALS
jgi:putative transport protein